MTDLQTPYATRLCLSGVESRRLLDTFKDFGVKHIQISYYYLRRVFSDPKEFEEYAKPFSTVIIDSGTVYHKFKTADEEMSFLGEYAAYLGALDKRAYTAAVYEEGAHIENTLIDEAIIYPLDSVRPIFDNDIDALCRNIKYIGVSHKEATERGGKELDPIFGAAKKHGTYVHLFGTSSRRILSKHPVYSANSSSWRSGSRYLNTYLYEGPTRGTRLYQPRNKKDVVRTERETKLIRKRQDSAIKVRQPNIHPLIDWDLLYSGDAWEVDKANLAQWMLYAQDLENAYQHKYFLNDAQQTEIRERRKEVLGKTAEQVANKEGRDKEVTPSETPAQIQEEKGHETEADFQEGSANKESAEATRANTEEPGYIGGQYIESEAIEVDSEVADIAEDSTDLLPGPPIGDMSGGSTPAHKSHKQADIVPYEERLTPVDPRLSILRQCNDCILADRCPKYAPDEECKFGLPPDNRGAYDHTSLERHVLEDAAELLPMQKDRIMQAYLEEKVDAAGLNKDLGKELERYFTMVQMLAEAQDKRDEVSIKAKGHGLMEMFKK